MSVEVDIRSKCRYTCTCQKSAGLITTKTGSLKDATEYGYCTHEKFVRQGIKGLNYDGQPLKIENGVGGNSTLFSDEHPKAWEVTTYYSFKHDKNARVIKVPLILRVKDARYVGRYDWYENASTNGDNLTWKRIEDAHGFPTKSNQSTLKFKENLDRVSCTIHNLHRVDISRNEQKNPYYCQICSNANVSINKYERVQEIYTKIDHTPTDNGEYYVTYENNLVKYKDPSKHTSKLWKLLSINKNSSLSVYHWEGDDRLNNPLLIEVKPNVGQSTWYENIGDYGGKHYKWIKLEPGETAGFSNYGTDLKKKLDRLSCTLNNAVRIHLGRDSGCHDSRDSNHKSTISTRHNGTVDINLKLSAYEYTSKESDGRPFSVSEVILKDHRQKIGSANLVFKDVTKVLSYGSFCDPTNPFLIFVELNTSKKNEWYERKTNNTWEKHDDLSGQIRGIFNSVKEPFKIKECSPATTPPKEGVKINITEQPKDNTLSGTYSTIFGTQADYIIINKESTSLKGFLRIVHKANTNGPFIVQQQLVDGNKIGSNKKGIKDVKETNVYFWQGEPDKPILVGISTNKSDGQTETKYYSYAATNVGGQGKGSWIQGSYDTLTSENLNFMLDDQNCQKNNAVPFEINNPTDPSKLYSDSKAPTCIKDHRKITESPSPRHPHGGEYTTKEYVIKGDARISRVTFDKNDTDIATKDTVTKVVVYYWKNDLGGSNEIPLLVGFVKSSGGYTFFENLGSPDSTKWKPVDKKESRTFYIGNSPQKDLTEKLDEVNCRIHHTVKINISNKGDPNKYCHGRCSPKRIKIIPTKKRISGCTGYDHISNISKETFTISSFYNGYEKQDVTVKMGFPLENVKKVTVYFPNCDQSTPVMIYIECSNQSAWLENKDKQGNWEDVSGKIPEVKSSLNLCSVYPGDGESGDREADGGTQEDHEETEESEEDLGDEGDPKYEAEVALQSATATTSDPQAHFAAQGVSGGAGYGGSPKDPPNSNWKVITGVSTGILGTSALACFVGWKLYNRYKGDPWVRQI
ncbi:hypothetical protein BEWA_038890 [Theileria equi strain WA]|uniref:Uncharacterized protein n=1 Tax=Theileria equi strain WA TaxID=1537102 RepID=L1LET4_THEEQ|nr:hypothetical protein BEWA_038890 [Theileria equi strain WA]EKX73851.1 hypothetical protein BEWA_038890 [Theileria equi strain WA]|eukprot:XP_004833303.1 hypothetical protein BEWA_038890 [Theileria equi strain WA]